MSLIMEPKGVDFIIQSPPLTDIERKEISDYIRLSKIANKRKSRISNRKQLVKV